MSEGPKGLNQEILDRLEKLEARVFGGGKEKKKELVIPPKPEPVKAEPPKGPEPPAPPPGVVNLGGAPVGVTKPGV